MTKRLIALTLACVMWSAGPARAALNYPLVAEFKGLQGEAISAGAVQHMEDDYEKRSDAVHKGLSKAIAKTDEGYGAHFRVRYRFKDGFIDVYSGIFDGGLQEIHISPRSMAEAMRLAQSLAGKELPINFKKPAERGAHTVTYQSEGDGCTAAVTLTTDAQGRCVEIDMSTAC